MIKLSRKMEYALMSLQFITASDENSLTTAKEISQRYMIPFDVTSRVLQLMARAGILASVQGVQGGYKKVRDLKSVSLLELVEVIEGKQTLVRCLGENEVECELHDSCQLKQPLKTLNDRLVDFCRTMPVNEIIVQNWPTNEAVNEVRPVN